MRERRATVILGKRSQSHLEFNKRIPRIEGLRRKKIFLRIPIALHIAQDDAAIDESRRIFSIDCNRPAEFSVGSIEIALLVAVNAALNCGEVRRLSGNFPLPFRKFLRHLARIRLRQRLRRLCCIARSSSIRCRLLLTVFLTHGFLLLLMRFLRLRFLHLLLFFRLLRFRLLRFDRRCRRERPQGTRERIVHCRSRSRQTAAPSGRTCQNSSQSCRLHPFFHEITSLYSMDKLQ